MDSSDVVQKKSTPKNNSPKNVGIVSNKKRVSFTLEKDLALLRLGLQHNPWQLGKDKWLLIASSMKALFNSEIRVRACQDRVNLLLQQLDKEELCVKTGTEEELSERGELLQEVKLIVAQSLLPINVEVGALDDSNDVLEYGQFVLAEDLENVVKNKGKSKLPSERATADKERDSLLTAASEDLAKKLHGRGIKGKLTPEDELMRAQQEHNMDIERKKIRLEELRQDSEINFQQRRLDMEQAKLDFEMRKEERLAEESKRRDEMAASQLKLQSNMWELMLSLSKAKDQ